MRNSHDIQRFPDIQGDGYPPNHLQTHLTKVGGRNQYGKPNFRLVIAECVIEKCSLDLPVFPDGADESTDGIPIREYCRMVNAGVPAEELVRFMEEHTQNSAPLRVEYIREQRKYSFTGPMIEKWHPANKYGSPEEWERIKYKGFPVLGPFPHEGAYERLGEFSKWPDRDFISSIISNHFETLAKQPESPAERRKQREAEFYARERARYKEMIEQFDAMQSEGIKTIMHKISLAAGRLREKWAKEGGHLDWGHVGN